MTAPRLTDTFFEAARTSTDLAKSWWLRKSDAIHSTPDGHGQPVLVIPGLGAGDYTTSVCRQSLDEKGYRSYAWKGGVNIGPHFGAVRHMIERLDKINQLHGEKVDIVGHSLGGIYARELARRYPDKVGHVVTLGSPFGIGFYPDAGVKAVQWLFEYFNPHASLQKEPALTKNLIVPPKSVPTTSLYSRTDGIVHWQSCINPPTEKSENIEIGTKRNPASHCGLIMKEAALAVMFDRLAEDNGRWRSFNRDEKPAIAALLRPDQIHEGRQPQKPQFTNEERAKIRAADQQSGILGSAGGLSRLALLLTDRIRLITEQSFFIVQTYTNA